MRGEGEEQGEGGRRRRRRSLFESPLCWKKINNRICLQESHASDAEDSSRLRYPQTTNLCQEHLHPAREADTQDIHALCATLRTNPVFRNWRKQNENFHQYQLAATRTLFPSSWAAAMRACCSLGRTHRGATQAPRASARRKAARTCLSSAVPYRSLYTHTDPPNRIDGHALRLSAGRRQDLCGVLVHSFHGMCVAAALSTWGLRQGPQIHASEEYTRVLADSKNAVKNTGGTGGTTAVGATSRWAEGSGCTEQ